MTAGAWLMLVSTWSVVTFFTLRFFWRVLTLPRRAEDEPAGERSRPRGRAEA